MRWLALLVLLVFAPSLPAQESKKISSFKGKDLQGKEWSSENHNSSKAMVVLFMGTECPINNGYMPRLAELEKQYKAKGVTWVGINANYHDTLAAIREHAQKFSILFPVLRDEGQLLAEQFAAQRIPEVIVLDADRRVRYRGRIDDQFDVGVQKLDAKKHFLVEALDAVLEGKEVANPKEPAVGCYITRKPRATGDDSITYSKQVASIVQKNCLECHRKGNIGPMPLASYQDVSSWSQMIKEVVSEKRMPPWHADPKYGKFFNDRSLKEEDLKTLLTWIDRGCPPGNKKEIPKAPQFSEGWAIGKPDVVFSMNQEFKVPAKAPKAGIKYQYFVVPTNFKEDMWVQAAEAKPGNRAVVHHIIVYVLVNGKRPNVSDGIGSGFLVAYAPGDLGAVFPKGSAKKIPKGANLAFQMHYTPNGTEHTDRSSLGLIFSKEPEYEIKTKGIAQRLLFIPPGAENHRTFVAHTFSNDVLVWNLIPHMHLRGKSFQYDAVYPDGKKETLLSVPKYDFGWQSSYRYEKPLLLPKGTRLECTAHFDNSTKNLWNPDPSQWIRWGDQTWEEMMIGFVDYTNAPEKKGGKLP